VKWRRVANVAQIRPAESMPVRRSKGTAGTARSEFASDVLWASTEIMGSPISMTLIGRISTP
jgi:hypothetical protein